MRPLALATLLALAACEPFEPGPYLYSTSAPELVDALGQAVVEVNAVAGCELLIVSEPGPAAIELELVSSHRSIDEPVLGCAPRGEAVDGSYPKRSIEVLRDGLDFQLELTVLHEVVHTLDRGHVHSHGYVMSLYADEVRWHPETEAYLQNLCGLMAGKDDER